MSLWWAKKEDLDDDQIHLIEKLALRQNFLVLGPPGSGKTNILLRRAQFVRGQEMPNVLVLTFTRALTEFVKTGCLDAAGREIFPAECITTFESWIRWLYTEHNTPIPDDPDFDLRKRKIAIGALGFRAQGRIPQFDSLFIDEAQDLFSEEVELIKQWSRVLFFVGDDRQQIYPNADGLEVVRNMIPEANRRALKFHYRLSPEICRMADRILIPQEGNSLLATQHYKGDKALEPKIHKPSSKDIQVEEVSRKLKDQLRVYADLIKAGDRLGVVVARKEDRDSVFDYFEKDKLLKGKSKVLRARDENENTYDPTLNPEISICILTIQACKGLEFRALHWLFSDDLSKYHTTEHYYTVITRAKTSLDIYCTEKLPQELARAHSDSGGSMW